MIIQRPECTGTTVIVGQSKSPKDLAESKMQQQHIKRLLSTAAAATGIVGDVDALPAPVQISHKAERNLWRLEEIKEVLNIMQQINALELLNDKTVKSEKVFRNIEQMMHRKGFRKKSHSQIWTKWKFLKSTYMTSRRNRIVPKMIPYEIYQILHKMLNSSFGTNAGNSSTASLDGDNSNCEDNSLNSGNTNNIKAEQNELAHPIFGFRLGLVKSEPVDTGYETTANNSTMSETDSLDDNTAFAAPFSPSNSNGNMTQHSFVDIKEERVTDSPTPPSPLLLSQTASEENSLLFAQNTKSLSITAISSQAETASKKPTPSTSVLSLPPLRIAPFANERNMKEALRRQVSSPPPLSMNPIALTAAQNSIEENGTTFVRKMLRNSDTLCTALANEIPTPLHNITTRPTVLRLPKEVTLQLRVSDADVCPTRLKQTPTRQTSYSLRPDRSTANLDETLAGTVLQNQTHLSLNNKDKTTYPHLEQPMTSQMASLMNARLRSSTLSNPKHKKRRLDIPTWNDLNTIQPAKITRMASTTIPDNQYTHDIVINNQCAFENQPKIASMKSKLGPSSTNEASFTSQPMGKERAVMEELLNDLAMSLRQTQLDMINNFFENQMEIARKEHEYQMKQDQLVMEAFQEQSRQLMNMANQVIELNLKRTQNKIVNDARKTNTNHHFSLKVNKRINEENSSPTSKAAGEEVNKSWLDESNESSSSCTENEPDNENAVDPIQFVSSELVEEYDNS